MGYTHINDSERRRVEKAIESGKGVREIARMTGRSPSSISEEIKNNSVRKKYTRKRAQEKARLRRKRSKIQCMKVAVDANLKKFVIEQIEDGQSPEAIAGRLKEVETHLPYASTKAIYTFVHSVHGRRIEKFLYSKAVKRRGGPKRGARKTSIDGRTMIDKRPKRVEKRKEFGHFEGDFIESGRDGKGSLLVLVERKTRYPFLVYTENRTTVHINALIAKTLRDVPVQSLTLDNDISFQKHEAMSELVDAAVFFCHAYHSWEKGTVENRNRVVRRYAPKRTDLSSVSIKRFVEIETILRSRFMKCLTFKTPREVWNIEMRKRGKKEEKKQKCATVNSLPTPIIYKNRCSA